jgi:hypothetical protein
MKRYLTLLFFLGVGTASQAQLNHRLIDSLLPGTWTLVVKADAKTMQSGGEMFLMDTLHFAPTGMFHAPNPSDSWQWNAETDSSFVIIDYKLGEGIEYLIQKLDQKELVIVWGTSLYPLRYVRVREK